MFSDSGHLRCNSLGSVQILMVFRNHCFQTLILEFSENIPQFTHCKVFNPSIWELSSNEQQTTTATELGGDKWLGNNQLQGGIGASTR